MSSNTLVQSFGNDPSHIIAASSSFMFLVSVAVALRLYCRLFMTKAFGIDDFFLLVAFSLYVAGCGTYIRQGIVEGNKVAAVEVLEMARLEVAFWTIYILNQIFLKLALGTFFLRILQQRWQRNLIIATTAFYTLFSFGFMLASLFRCGARHPGTMTYFSTQCVSWTRAETPLNTLHAGLNALVDIIFVVSPMILVIQTKMPGRTKVGVCSLLAFAGLGSVVSVIRVPFIYSDVEIAPAVFENETPVAIFSLAETGIGLICLCVAALRPLARVWASQTRRIVSSIAHHRQCKCEGPCSIANPDPQGGRPQTPKVEEAKVEKEPNSPCSKRDTFSVLREGEDKQMDIDAAEKGMIINTRDVDSNSEGSSESPTK